MRSRLAILLTLVLGFALSGAGASLAVSGLAGDETVSSTSAYAPAGGPTLVTPSPSPSGTVAGETDESEPAAEETNDADVAGDRESAPTSKPAVAAETAVQATRQAGANSGELPLTGWAAIPVLLLGLGLLAAGFTLRRGSRSSS